MGQVFLAGWRVVERVWVWGMEAMIERVLITEEEILARLDVVAAEVMAEVGDCEELVVVALLKGALVFVADMTRRMPVPLVMECVNVASYHGGTESSGEVKFLDAGMPDVRGKKVVVMDDILDTGLTMSAVLRELMEAGAARVWSCVLLSKRKERSVECEADWVCFEIDDDFVVGYGLDFEGRYRNLPYVGVMKAVSS